MIVIATASFIVRKGLTDIIKELYPSLKIIDVSLVDELENLRTQHKVKLLLVSNEINLHLNPANYKEIQLIKLIDVRPEYIDVDGSNAELIFLNDSEQVIKHVLKRNLALMDKHNSNSKSESELSDRELDIVREVALGQTNKEIADKLYISVHTVITHRKNITRKLGIKTVSGLTVYALLNKLIKIGDNI